MDTNSPLPAHVRSVLRDADAALLRLAGESHHLLYQFLHRTVARLAPTDSFYIGFYCEGEMMVFPYSYDGVTYYDPNKFAYRPDGLAAWMLQNQRAYAFSLDGGELLRRGKSYGQKEKRSQDAVAVPILEDEGRKRKRVSGILSIQSYEPAVYGAEVVPALEWLARGLAIVLERERADAVRLTRYALALRREGLQLLDVLTRISVEGVRQPGTEQVRWRLRFEKADATG